MPPPTVKTRRTAQEVDPPAPEDRPRPRKFGMVAPRLTAAAILGWYLASRSVLQDRPELLIRAIDVGLLLLLVVTLHEFGHYLAGACLGLRPYIRVSPLLGYCAPTTEGERRALHTTSGRVVFAAAGPAANLITAWLISWAPVGTRVDTALASSPWPSARADFVTWSLILGLVNLIPAPVLDGGHIAIALAERARPMRRRRAILALRAFGTCLLATAAVRLVGSPATPWLMVPNALLFVGAAWASASMGELPLVAAPMRLRDALAVLAAGAGGVGLAVAFTA